MEILGDEVPEHLRRPASCAWRTSRLPWRNSVSSHDPPMTKDAVAGRIRRLLATADKRAAELGIPTPRPPLGEMLLDS
jgi:DNA-binding transcriptional regulator WhiA